MKKIVTLIAVFSAILIFQLTLVSGFAGGTEKTVNGPIIYNQNCSKCHGSSGKGVENFTPDLTRGANKSNWLTTVSNGKNSMPRFKDTLSQAQITAVVRYIRSLSMTGNKKN